MGVTGVLFVIGAALTVDTAMANRPLVLEEVTTLSFGSLVVIDEEAAATYELFPEGGSFENNVAPLGGPGIPGEFTVSGQGGEGVVITFSPSISLLCQEEAETSCTAGDSLTVTTFTTNYADDVIILNTPGGGGGPPGGFPPGGGPEATETFFVGAELQLQAYTADGLYEGTFTVTANYE